jgi:catechol 2,3-dioxygenase-like lactoylglutathione lyase family enzyme
MRGRDRFDAGTDRWQRSDWWGVVLEAPDPRALGRFYSELLGWKVYKEDAEGVALDAGEGVGYLAVQRAEVYEPPVWPPQPGRQGMQLHLDFEVSDLEQAVAHAVELGAVVADFQPQEDVRVLLDPAGHPFCLYA